MRNIMLMLAPFLIIGASDPAPAPDLWLQARLDRILVASGRTAGAVKAVISQGTDLSWEQPAATLEVPRALLAMAPSPQALDGLLAMMLSYQQEPRTADGRRIDPVSALAYGALVAGTGGATDPNGQASSRTVPLGPGKALEASDPADMRRAKAWRGARWNSMAGNCIAPQVDFLRLSAQTTQVTVNGQAVRWTGSEFSRRIVTDLGAQAYPGEERCRPSNDPDFASVQQRIRAGSPD